MKKQYTIDEKCRVIVPATIRKALGIDAGDRVRIAQSNQCIVMKKCNSAIAKPEAIRYERPPGVS